MELNRPLTRLHALLHFNGKRGEGELATLKGYCGESLWGFAAPALRTGVLFLRAVGLTLRTPRLSHRKDPWEEGALPRECAPHLGGQARADKRAQEGGRKQIREGRERAIRALPQSNCHAGRALGGPHQQGLAASLSLPQGGRGAAARPLGPPPGSTFPAPFPEVGPWGSHGSSSGLSLFMCRVGT